MTVLPTSGIAFDTLFSVTLTGYDSALGPNDMTFILYGVVSRDPLEELRLTPTEESLTSGNIHEYNDFVLPQVIAIKAVVKDKYGEQNAIESPVDISASESTTWKEIYDLRKANILKDLNEEKGPAPPPDPTMWQSYQSIGS